MGEHRMSRRQKAKFDQQLSTGQHAEWSKRKQGPHKNDRDKRKTNKKRQELE